MKLGIVRGIHASVDSPSARLPVVGVRDGVSHLGVLAPGAPLCEAVLVQVLLGDPQRWQLAIRVQTHRDISSHVVVILKFRPECRVKKKVRMRI